MKRIAGGRAPHMFVVGAALLATGACGSQQLPVAEPRPTTTEAPLTEVPTATEAPATTEPSDATTTTAPADRAQVTEWVNVTGNLAGIESYCGNLSYMSARPGSTEVLASVVGQGVFVNDGASDAWAPLGQGEGSAVIDHRMSGVVYDPDAPDRFWESGYFGLGPPPDAQASDANRSDDGGQTFIALAPSERADGISVDFTDPERQTLLLGLRAQERALRSDDGGASWTDVSETLPGDLGEASFPFILDTETFLLGTHRGDRGAAANPGIFRTTDAGATWTKVFDGGVSGQPLVSGPGIYWVLQDRGVVGSTDGGVTWELVSNFGPGNSNLDARRNALVETPEGDWISMDPQGILLSPDRGENWSRIGGRFPWGDAADGFTYSAEQNAVYAWKKWCRFTEDTNPVLEDAIYRFEFVTDE